LKDLSRSYPSFGHLKTLLKLYMKDNSVGYFSYKLVEDQANKYTLHGDLVLNARVAEINLDQIEEVISIPTVLSLREGSFYDTRKEVKMIGDLTSLVKSRGYPRAVVKTSKELGAEGYSIKFLLNKGKPRLVKQIKILSD